MKLIIQAMLLSSALVGMASFAETTPVQFVKGSYCGSFDGNVVGRKFTLQLNAGQLLSIEVNASKDIYPIVKDPKGKTLVAVDESNPYAYNTTKKGKYTVSFDVEDESYPYAEIKFCAP